MIPTHVPEAQLALPGLTALSVAADDALTFNTVTGEIVRGSSLGAEVVVRGPGVGTIAGIDFALITQSGAPSIGSFAMASFNVSARGEVNATGDAALVILSQEAVVIAGRIDVGASVLEGGSGGYDSEAGPGVGGAADTNGFPEPACGGGGFGGRGGAGDDDGLRNGGAGGTTYGDATLTLLQGGSGGGRGENGRGGGGGGAVQITSLISITVTGVITAPGDGGRPDQEGAGGGGAGGAIFLEAPSIFWTAPGILAVNGGGGGGGNTFTDNSGPGARGLPSTAAAQGGVSDALIPDGRGGAGAAGGANNGSDGSGFAPSGGGGGGGGRVRVLTFSGFAPAGIVASPNAAISAGRISVR
jgi:hypothetical protein